MKDITYGKHIKITRIVVHNIFFSNDDVFGARNMFSSHL